MADRPIIFSAPMVHALLDGRKAQTRRVLKGKSGVLAARSVLQRGAHWLGIEYDRSWPLRLPYALGDRLWVREAFGIAHRGDSTPGGNPYDPEVYYRADDEAFEPEGPQWEPWRWRPSIHMPRWASRLTLTVTDVRVQRLQEISEADAVAEGWPGPITNIGYPISTPPQWFAAIWNSLHGPDAWAANPWVCAMTFTVQRGNIDRLANAPAPEGTE